LFSHASQSKKLGFFQNSRWVDTFIQDEFTMTKIVE
jgi:hypothetical protein